MAEHSHPLASGGTCPCGGKLVYSKTVKKEALKCQSCGRVDWRHTKTPKPPAD